MGEAAMRLPAFYHPSAGSWLRLVVVLFLASGGRARGREGKVLDLQRLQLGESVFEEKCLPQRSRREKGATILEVKHHSYCSRPIENHEERLSKLLVSDNERADSIQSRLGRARSGRMQAKLSEAQIPLTSGANLQTMNYIVAIELGGQKMTVVVDTGSDLTWVQCKPCTFCYDQQDPLFDPSASPSYRATPCDSPVCDSLQSTTGTAETCSTGQPNCNYDINYGDGSYSRGVLSQEQVNLAGTIVPDFVFGCGQSNQGMFGRTSGLMGLGHTQLSLVSQTTALFGGVFSYCLPTKEYGSSGSLVFGSGGDSVYRNSTPVVYTRMISDPGQRHFYFANLTGISIGGVAVQASGFSNSKVLIDSGTVITRLVPSVYQALKAEFLKQFSSYPLVPGFSILDTCFNLAGYKQLTVPTMTFKFEGSVEVDVDVTGVLYFVTPDASLACLALASLAYEDGVPIIGNYQQKNLRVVYDTKGSRLGFAEETCGYS